VSEASNCEHVAAVSLDERVNRAETLRRRLGAPTSGFVRRYSSGVSPAVKSIIDPQGALHHDGPHRACITSLARSRSAMRPASGGRRGSSLRRRAYRRRRPRRSPRRRRRGRLRVRPVARRRMLEHPPPRSRWHLAWHSSGNFVLVRSRADVVVRPSRGSPRARLDLPPASQGAAP
jgi:hypothetical protein